MSAREWLRYPSMRAALAALALALGIGAWTVVRAVHLEAVPELPPPTLASSASLATVVAPPAADIPGAIEKDPFSPDRTAPETPYRLPGEPDPKAVETTVEAPQPVVLGTAVSGDGRSFAVMRLGDASPTSLHVGDKIGPYTVKSIERGRVVFTTLAGKRLDVLALKP
jgi:hypothetical protein